MTLSKFVLSFTAVYCSATLALAGTAAKAPPSDAVAPKEKSVYDQIWGLADWYDNPDNPVVQAIRLTGRFHMQYHWTDLDTGSSDDFEFRRFRIGLEMDLFKEFMIKGEMLSGSDFDPFYNGFTELYVQWKPSSAFALLVGKQKPKFTYDWTTSSRYHLYFERSQILNHLKPDYTPGIVATGKLGKKWGYYAGVFSNSPSDELSEEFSAIDGTSYIAKISYDLSETLGVDSAEWSLEYLHSETNENSSIFTTVENAVATSVAMRQGRFGAAVEVVYGEGGDDGDVFGVNLMPTWKLTDRLHLVSRYQVATSNGEEGLNPQRRYEREAGGGAGDLYQAGYLGFDYYIYGHKMKLMTGVEYASMSGSNGYEGWTGLVGLRFFWGPDSKGSFPTGTPKAGE
jgi:phosphate-selective porin OprO and OprP